MVDSNLKTIHDSYLNFEKLKRNTQSPLKTLLINNFVTGCTIGMNRALLKMACPIPDQAFMHDWWCALCAAATGKIGFINKPTMLYRQHHHNTIGSKGFYGKFRELFYFNSSFMKRRKNLKGCFNQANSLLSRIDHNNKNYILIKKFSGLSSQNILMRYLTAISLKVRPSGWMRVLVFWGLLGMG